MTWKLFLDHKDVKHELKHANHFTFVAWEGMLYRMCDLCTEIVEINNKLVFRFN